MSSDKKHRFGRNWMNEHLNDSYVKKAKKSGYRARSAFKLEEIDKKDKLLRPGLNVVDLGAAPGGWCQYARKKLIMLLNSKLKPMFYFWKEPYNSSVKDGT